MNKTLKKSNKGVQKGWNLIEPDKIDSMMSVEQRIQKGEVTNPGIGSKCRSGDIVIFRDWMIEKINQGEQILHYVPDEAILHIL